MIEIRGQAPQNSRGDHTAGLVYFLVRADRKATDPQPYNIRYGMRLRSQSPTVSRHNIPFPRLKAMYGVRAVILEGFDIQGSPLPKSLHYKVALRLYQSSSSRDDYSIGPV